MALAVSVVVRYRKAVTYGVHALLAALDSARVEHDLRLGTTPEETARHIRDSGADRVLVLWSFYSPDAEAMAAELATVRSLSGGRGLHIAGGVHATAEPQQVIDAGWDLAGIGEGESTIIALVRALREDRPLTSVPGLAVRDADGVALRTAPAPQLPLDAFPSFTGRNGPIEITRGCRYTCRFCQTPFMFGGQFRHRSVASVREHVREMAGRGMRDVRFITPTSLSYGSPGPDPDLGAVEELLAGESEEDQARSLTLAADLADLGARIHTHTFMPLPGTPWRDAEPAFIPLATMAELDRLAQRGDAYGHWRKQAEHAVRLAETAKAYPRRTRRRRTT
ncbi:radical SAM protein [Nonomuraea fuscirosea]|uniref:radical SAM protein n=1 Tax=Nonomuraea fuscirosea TaxID=1291556 RepID=UPI003434A280